MKIKHTFHKLLSLYLVFTFTLILTGCDSSKLQKTPLSQFEGVWQLEGRAMFEDIIIKIEENKEGKLVGRVIEINDDKYVNMFVSINDIWVSSIDRSSNYQFKITEKKIASGLFSVYGLNGSKEYKVEFIDINTIGLADSSTDPNKSMIKYTRIK